MSPQCVSLLNLKSHDIFDEKKNDIFSLGCSIFYLIFKELPYCDRYIKSEKSDKFELLGKKDPELIRQQYKIQSEKIESEWGKENFDNFLGLIFECLEKDENKRSSAEDVLKHPFFEGLFNNESFS